MDNNAQAIATLVAGMVALEVYSRSKFDEKKNAARMIYAEMTGAEDRVKSLKIRFKDSGGKDIGRDIVLSSDSWSKYRHLFIKDFTDKQWRKINDFYEDCESLNGAVRENNSFFGYNSQAIRNARYSAAASFITKAINEVEEGKFTVLKPDGTSEVSVDQEAALNTRIKLELTAFNEILENSTNSENVHYNPLKPINDTQRTLELIDLGISDDAIGIAIRKTSERKRYLVF